MGTLTDREMPEAADAPAADRIVPASDRAMSAMSTVAGEGAPDSVVAMAGNAAVARHVRAGGISPRSGLFAWDGAGGNRAISRALAGPDAAGGVPEGFADRLGAAESGQAIPREARQSLETAFGTSLADVRLHVGSRSGALAEDIDANAFAVGSDIYFGHGQFDPDSPRGYHLLAHEVAHTVQGAAAPEASGKPMTEPSDSSEVAAEEIASRVAGERQSTTAAPPSDPGAPDKPVTAGVPATARTVARTTAARSAVARSSTIGPIARDGGSMLPDFVLDGVRAAVATTPGYTALTVIIGKDPITDKPLAAAEGELVEQLLTFGPFGATVSQALRAVEVIGEIVAAIRTGLAEHNLTLARVERDFAAAWQEMSLEKGIGGNVAIAHRYVSAFTNDLLGFVNAIADRIIAMVRAVVAKFAEPLLETPQIKPTWDLAKKVFHHDPLRDTPVDAPTVEILGDFLNLIGRQDVLAQMRERGTLQQTADWLDTQFATFAKMRGDAGKLFSDAWDAISPANLPNLPTALSALADRAFELIKRIADFVTTIMAKVLELIKHSLLGFLSQHAHKIPGFGLLTVIIGDDPFTGELVPLTAESLIKGFFTLLPDGEASYEQLAQSGVIAQAATQIENAISRLGISSDLIVNTFRGVWNTLELADLLEPIAAFERVMKLFGDPIERIVEFAIEVVKVVITLILKLMNFPSDLLESIIDNAMAAIGDIEKNPVGFLINMLAALKTGVAGFLDGIGGFLLKGLESWLLHGLGEIGVAIPQDFSFQSILKLVLDVLGLSIEHLWQKLGQHIGQETVAKIRGAVGALGEAWAFVKDVEEGGIGALWTHLTDRLSGLWDTVLGMARDWIMTEIVEKVTEKLLSMLDPTGVMAVVNSFIAFFKAIQSAVEYLRDILKIVNEYVTTFVQVAEDNIAPGAEKIKQGLGEAVPVAIGFLANQVGLGDIAAEVVKIFNGLRTLVDEAIDWLITKALELGQAALNALGLGGPDQPAPGAAGRPEIHEVVVAFSVGENQHHLFGAVRDGQLVIEMASNRDHLVHKIEVAMKDERIRKDQTAIDSLTQARAELEGQQERQRIAPYQEGGEQNARKVEADVRNELLRITALLQGVGQDFDVESLREDPDVLGGEVRIEINIRSDLYGDITGKAALKARAREELRQKKNDDARWKAEDPNLFADTMSYICPGPDYNSPHLTAEPMELEHVVEVVKHWNSGHAGQGPGRAQSQRDRVTWNNYESNLRGMCRECNQEKERIRQQNEGKEYIRLVLVGFSGRSSA